MQKENKKIVVKRAIAKSENPKNQTEFWIADRPSMPGSPPIGRGSSFNEALGDLIFRCNKDFDIEEIIIEPVEALEQHLDKLFSQR